MSPLNLKDSAFETPSYNGSFSGYLAVVLHSQGQPQRQVVIVPPDCWYTCIQSEDVFALLAQPQVCIQVKPDVTLV